MNEESLYSNIVLFKNYFKFNEFINDYNPEVIPKLTNYQWFSKLDLLQLSKLYYFFQHKKLNVDIFSKINIETIKKGLNTITDMFKNYDPENGKNKYQYYLYPCKKLISCEIFFIRKLIGLYLSYVFKSNKKLHDFLFVGIQNIELYIYLSTIYKVENVKKELFLKYNTTNEIHRLNFIDFIGYYKPQFLFNFTIKTENEGGAIINIFYKYFIRSNKQERDIFYSNIVKVLLKYPNLIMLYNNYLVNIINNKKTKDYITVIQIRFIMFELIKVDFFDLDKTFKILLSKLDRYIITCKLDFDEEFNLIFEKPTIKSIIFVINIIKTCIMNKIPLSNISKHIKKVNFICINLNKNCIGENDKIIQYILTELFISLQILYNLNNNLNKFEITNNIFSIILSCKQLGVIDIHNLILFSIFNNIPKQLIKKLLYEFYKIPNHKLLEIHSLLLCLYGKEVYRKEFYCDQAWDTNLFVNEWQIQKKKLLILSVIIISDGNKKLELGKNVIIEEQTLNLNNYYDILTDKLITKCKQ